MVDILFKGNYVQYIYNNILHKYKLKDKWLTQKVSVQ